MSWFHRFGGVMPPCLVLLFAPVLFAEEIRLPGDASPTETITSPSSAQPSLNAPSRPQDACETCPPQNDQPAATQSTPAPTPQGTVAVIEADRVAKMSQRDWERFPSDRQLRSRTVRERRTRTEPSRTPRSRSGHEALRDSVNGEMHDIARAIRSLDQSYYYKGFSSGKAWTAGSAYLDRKHYRSVPDRNEVEVTRAKWPSSLEAACFVWEEHIEAPIDFRGDALLTQTGWWKLTGGAVLAPQSSRCLLELCRRTNELTIETVLTTTSLKQSGPARIISFSSSASSRNFTLCQEGDKLVLRLRTPQTGENGTGPEVVLTTLPIDTPTHVVVTYRPGELRCYFDGELVARSDRLRGDFSNWTPQHLVFGDEWDGGRDWSGGLERVAIYGRVLTPGEVRRNAEACHLMNANR